MTHFRLYWGSESGNLLNMEEYASSVFQVNTKDVFPAPGIFYFLLKAWNGLNEFAVTSEFAIAVDIGHFRVRK